MTEAAVATAVEDEAAFSKGFESAPAQAAPEQAAPEQATETAPETTATETQTTKVEPTEAEKPQLIAGMTEADWNAAVAKAAGPLVEAARSEVRKNFGQIGELKKTLTELRGQIAAGGNASRKITAETLKRVNEELPGLGDALAQDLAEIFGSPAIQAEADKAQASAEAKGQTFDSEAFFAQKIGPALEQLEARANERAELRIVKSVHRDFEAVVKSPEFSSWLTALPEDRQKTIRESDDGFVAADAVTEFKAWRDKAAKQKADKANRLDRATTPSGDRRQSGHVPNDEEAEFNRGFNSVK